MQDSETPLDIWNAFCSRFRIAEDAVPLFDTVAQEVTTRPFGRDNRSVLKRSASTDAMLNGLHRQLTADFDSGTNKTDGLLYFMFWLREGSVIPLYIGRSRKLSNNGAEINSDIRGFKFGRWSDDRDQHFGELSVAALGIHCGREDWAPLPTYVAWAEKLFTKVPATTPALREPTYFFALNWEQSFTGIWPAVGATSVGIQENLLIAVASLCFPEVLLNSDGT